MLPYKQIRNSIQRYAFLSMLLFCVLPASATQLVGTLRNPDGTGFNGVLYLSLVTQAHILATGSCGGPTLAVPSQPVVVPIHDGTATWPNVYGADCMATPVQYVATLFDNGSGRKFVTKWLIQGSVQDVGTIYDGTTTVTPPTSTPSTSSTLYTGSALLTDTVTGQYWLLSCINGHVQAIATTGGSLAFTGYVIFVDSVDGSYWELSFSNGLMQLAPTTTSTGFVSSVELIDPTNGTAHTLAVSSGKLVLN